MSPERASMLCQIIDSNFGVVSYADLDELKVAAETFNTELCPKRIWLQLTIC